MEALRGELKLVLCGYLNADELLTGYETVLIQHCIDAFYDLLGYFLYAYL